MLQLDISLDFTEEQQKHIDEISKTTKWNSNSQKTKDLKKQICKELLRIQNCQCVFCETYFFRPRPEIEHFADKSRYSQFCFEPKNLMLACSACNGSSGKHTYDTIAILHSKYEFCQFKIVHPLLDKISEHFIYKNQDEIIFDMEKCSTKAKETIKLFKWDSYPFTLYLAQKKQGQEHNTPFDKEKLIREILTYK